MKKNKVTIILVGIIAILAISLAVTFAVTWTNSKKRQSGFYYINLEGEVVSGAFDKESRPGIYGECYFDEHGIAKISKKNGENTTFDDEIYFIDTNFKVIGNRIFTYGNVLEWEYDNQVYFLCREGNDFQILDSNMNLVSSIEDYFFDDSKLIACVSHRLAKGLIPICSKESNYEKMGYIDIYCNYAIEPKFCYCVEFSDDDLAIVRAESGKKGVIDKTGKYVIEPIYFDITSFSQGVAMAQETENGGARLIDKTGKFAIKLDKREGSFSGGYAVVEDETGKYGFIDEEGNLVIPCQYDDLIGFTDDGIAPVKVGNLWGYIRTDNTWFLEPQFDDAYTFRNGYAYIWLNEDQQIKK